MWTLERSARPRKTSISAIAHIISRIVGAASAATPHAYAFRRNPPPVPGRGFLSWASAATPHAYPFRRKPLPFPGGGFLLWASAATPHAYAFRPACAIFTHNGIPPVLSGTHSPAAVPKWTNLGGCSVRSGFASEAFREMSKHFTVGPHRRVRSVVCELAGGRGR